MQGITGKGYWFKIDTLSKAPTGEGIYMIMDRIHRPIFAGRGKIRERLTSHFNQQEPIDKRIWEREPRGYYREVCLNSKLREKQLIEKYSPPCNKKPE